MSVRKVNIFYEAELETSRGKPVPIFMGSFRSFEDQGVPIYRDDYFQNEKNKESDFINGR